LVIRPPLAPYLGAGEGRGTDVPRPSAVVLVDAVITQR
jgi:hypothetical protein